MRSERLAQVQSPDEVVRRFDALFRPKSIAVVGVSTSAPAQGNKFIAALRTAGYQGAIHPIHPSAKTLEGLQAYRSLADVPEPIDYAFIAIPADAVSGLLEGAAGRLRFAQVMSSGFDEPQDGQDLAQVLLKVARDGGIRILGPNCMGTHSPRGQVSFIDEDIGIPGCVGVMSQSGGLTIDIVRQGRQRGLRFSGVVSLGNCLDVGPNEMLEYYLADPDTRVIGAYLESVDDGRRFFEQLRAARAVKPIILLKGGRTEQGQRAVASHTGSLAGSDRVWRALARQTGSILVDTLAQLLDALVAFQATGSPSLVAPVSVTSTSGESVQGRPASSAPMSKASGSTVPSGRVILFGNGGGASVLASDMLGRLGLEVPPLGAKTAAALNALDIPAGASVANPVDVPANILQRENGALARRILETIAAHESPEAIVMHLNLPVLLGYRHIDMLGDLVQAALELRKSIAPVTHLLLVLRATGQPEMEARKLECAAVAMAAGIPVFGDLPEAADALFCLHRHAVFRHSRCLAGGSETR